MIFSHDQYAWQNNNIFQKLTCIFILCLWRQLCFLFSRSIQKIGPFQKRRWGQPCSPSQLSWTHGAALPHLPAPFPSTAVGMLHFTLMAVDKLSVLKRYFSIFCVCSHLTFRNHVGRLQNRIGRVNSERKGSLEMPPLLYIFLTKMKTLFHFWT